MRAWNAWLGGMTVALAYAGMLGVGLAGCGTTNSDPGTTTGGTSGGGGTPSTGGRPRGTDTLEGTWDYWVSTESGITSGTIEIAPDRFRLAVDVDEAEFQYWDDAGTLGAVYNETGDGAILSVTRTAAAFDTGALALALGGTWEFRQASEPAQCWITLQQDTFSWSCEGVSGTDLLPCPTTDLVGTRTRALASMFGDLGGEWLVDEPSTGQSCTITFEGATFTADCTAAPNFGGSVTIGFSGNTASGTVSPGGEISALRR